MKRIILLVCVCLILSSAWSSRTQVSDSHRSVGNAAETGSAVYPELPLLPRPQQYTESNGRVSLNCVFLSTETTREKWKDFFNELDIALVESPNATSLPRHTTHIEAKLVRQLHGVPINSDEAYRLTVKSDKITIEAVTEKGEYWAMQTLRQLIQNKGRKKWINTCSITDWPAFRIRGFMQDVGRTYISLAELKREIRILSQFKVNVFHWHLTENQAWRLESRVFPMLNDSANMTRMPGKFYTLAEARDLVAYCRSHGVTLIPEIDMPGHSAAFVRTFHHDMQSKDGMRILKLLLDEVCETFDVPYLHIGTDEVAFTNPTFVPEMVAYVRSKGKKVISWNPGWKYQAGDIDLTQLWSARGKAQPGIAAIDSRLHYLNHYDTFGDLVALYNSRIYHANEGSEDIAGGILAVWNDRYVSNEQNIALENHLYPCMLAFAERSWLGGGTEYFDKYGTIIPLPENQNQAEIFHSFADFETRMLWHKEHTFRGYPFGYVKQSNVRWNITDAFPNAGDLTRKFPPEQQFAKEYVYDGNTYHTHEAIGAGIYLRHVWGTLIPAFFKNPKENHTAYAYTWVFSPRKQTVGLWAEFQNYSRSEMDLPPLPGKWDYKESQIWLNDRLIPPPIWTGTHNEHSNEIPLGNENCVARPPIPVILNKGWNKVLIKLPVGAFTTPEVRLVKWMFTTVFVTLDGQKAVDGLIYDPNQGK